MASEDRAGELTEPAGLSSSQIAASITLAVAVAVLGGWVCGLAMVNFALLGAISFSLLGFVAGIVLRQIVGRSSAALAGVLIGALLLATAWGIVFWLKTAEFNVGGADTWGQAVQLLFKQPQIAAGTFYPQMLCAGVGVYSIWRQAGSKWRTVRVADR